MRHLAGMGQTELAKRAGVAQGLISMVENGRTVCASETLDSLARALGCGPRFLTEVRTPLAPTRPWLRAYADASQKSLDRQLADVSNAIDLIDELPLRRVPVSLPELDGDLNDPAAVEAFALDVRDHAGLEAGDVIGNMVRTAERLGCVVLPMDGEIGRRHLGFSTRFGKVPVISVSRPSRDPERHVPGDRQRFTVAHELGHLTLHEHLDTPASGPDSRRIEKQAHRFAAAFLAPGDAMLEELEASRGRVTLTTLGEIKATWGISIKALVGRFRDLGVIEEDKALSLYKQIAARGYNKGEPIEVGNESAVWLASALRERTGDLDSAIHEAAALVDLPRAHIDRWLDWSPTEVLSSPRARVIPFPVRGE